MTTCPNCGHPFKAPRSRTAPAKYQERPGKLPRYMSGYESYRRSWLAAQGKSMSKIPMKKETP